jgi:hypothetical protein
VERGPLTSLTIPLFVWCHATVKAISTTADPENLFLQRCAARGLLEVWGAVSIHLYRVVANGNHAAPETALAVVNRTRELLTKYKGGVS